MTSLTEHPSPPSEPLFRPAKRRKFYRKRLDDNDSHPDPPDAASLPHAPSASASVSPPPAAAVQHPDSLSTLAPQTLEDDDEASGPAPSISEILKRRRAHMRRANGVEFSASRTTSGSAAGRVEEQARRALIERSGGADEDLVAAAVSRFAPQTGSLVADVNDRHMMEYIEAELARRRGDATPSSSNAVGIAFGDEAHLHTNTTTRGADAIQRQPAALGKLHEIDLGPDATLRNIQLTEAATRRLQGEEPAVPEETSGGRKLRLGKDGKPWRGGRKRRTSEDLARDRLVEEVLRESRLEIYDEPDARAVDDDGAADDRIAEQFRKEFMDAISNRQVRRGPPPPSGPNAKKDAQQKGPKLGGSRSARAAMREQQEKAMKK